MKQIFSLIFFLLMVVPGWGQQLSLSVQGDVNFGSATYSVSEAGNDFAATMESNSASFLSVSYVNWWDRWRSTEVLWRVHVSKSEIEWSPDLNIEIKRAGAGTRDSWWGPSPELTHGDNYQPISNNPSYFFKGRYGANNIPLNFRLSGASLTMGAKQFSTRVVFTVYDD